ncbi:MAG: phosphopentomutase [Pseudomonadota bacterium]
MPRAILIVLDSVGIGGAPDAAQFGDEGANTLGHIAAACAAGDGDREGLRSGPLQLPNLTDMGLGRAAELSTGVVPDGMAPDGAPLAAYAALTETSTGKDTPSGHWELAGVPVEFQWGTFPDEQPAFPEALTEAIIREGALPGILANCHASGTEVIERFGDEHIQSKKPIIYTSVDSVIQIAAHEDFFGLDRLYALCATVRKIADPYNVGRVIARPFTGMNAASFERTSNRRDYSVPPPAPTLLDRVSDDAMSSQERAVFAVGKIADIFAHRGVTDVRKGTGPKASGNDALIDATLQTLDDAADGDFVFVNLVDFDSEYGHRRDVPGYAACLERFDARLPEITAKLRDGDLLVLTADHGNDPTWHGTDHTRERVFALLYGPNIRPGSLGVRATFADVDATLAKHLGVPAGPHGEAML